MDPRLQAWLNVNTQDGPQEERVDDVWGQLQAQAPQGAEPGLDPEFMRQLMAKIEEWQRMQGLAGAGSMGAGAGQLNQLGNELNDF